VLVLALSCRDAAVFPPSGGGGGGGGGGTGGNEPSPIIWERISAFPARQVYALAVRDNLILAGCDSGTIYRSDDSGRNWSPAAAPAFVGDIEVMLLASPGTAYASSSAFGVLRSVDGGSSWSRCGLPDSLVGALSVLDPPRIIVGTLTGHCLVSLDSGATWTEQFRINRPITFILPSSSSSSLLATWGGGVFLNTFGTAFLEGRNDGLLNAYLHVLGKTPSGRLLAGTSGGGIFKSTNDGGTWERWGDSLIGKDVVAVFETGERSILAGTFSGPYLSTDAGLHWGSADSGYAAERVYCFQAASGGGILAGSENGLYRTGGPAPRSD
jgi:photosystem II stability/assembly factor-like uncharacterized protein